MLTYDLLPFFLQYFDGHLDRAQNGIWSGSMIACKEKEKGTKEGLQRAHAHWFTGMVPFRRSQQERLAFVCRFQPPGEHTHGKTTIIHFVFIAGKVKERMNRI